MARTMSAVAQPVTSPTPRIPVSRRALYQRIDRQLAKRGQRLKAYRTSRESTGYYFIVDVRRSVVVREQFRGLEALGRKLRVLAPWEEADRG
jgi:hypothetical protein